MEDKRYACPTCCSVYRLGYSRCPIDGAVLQQTDGDPLVGETLAERYMIERCIGEGGMGRVYRARHLRVSRKFAIKVLFGELATDPRMRERFGREAEAASRLSHPNVVSVVDVGESEEGLLYLAMDYVEGQELREFIDDNGALGEERAVAIMLGLCRGLEHAHRAGIVHRDFKAENVLVSTQGGEECPKIVDFGISMLAENVDERLTTNGVVVGTPSYMSPEQAMGMEIDARTDLFSLGVVMYELLAGMAPFDGDPMAIARQNLTVTPPPFAERVPGLVVDPELEKICMKLMEKRPEDRYQHAREAEVALMATRSGAACVGAGASLEAARRDQALDDGDTMLVGVQAVPAPAFARARIAVVAVLMLLVAGAAWKLLGGSEKRPDRGSESVATSEGAETAGAQDTGQEVANPDESHALAPPSRAIDAGAESEFDFVAEDTSDSEVDSNRRRRTEKDRRRLQGGNDKDGAGEPTEPAGETAPRTAENQVSTNETAKNETAKNETAKNETAKNETAKNETAKNEVAEVPTTKTLTQRYTEVGAALQTLRKHDPELAASLGQQYSAIPFSEALRVAELRADALRRLSKLDRQIRGALRN